MTPNRWEQVDPRLRSAWESLRQTGKRRFHDEDPELVTWAQRAFLRCGPHAVRYSPWFDGGGQQFPLDYIAYQEILYQTAPKMLIETGTGSGGTTLFFAEVLHRKHGNSPFRVITTEINKDYPASPVKNHRDVISLIGDSVDMAVLDRIRSEIDNQANPVAVTLDSDHDAQHVLAELDVYAPLVSPGHYLIVQDTFIGLYWGGNLDGMQAREAVARGDVRAFDYHGCPLGAVEAFLDVHGDEWEIDLEPMRFLLTQNPYGYLRRRS